jgi:2-(1,2-epoxy-1,2-dihydrophenyl)acetyl-CoA isomerase
MGVDAAAGERAAFELDTESGVARLRLTRAAGRNAIDADMVASLSAAVAQAAESVKAARVLIIDAAGPSFTVGGDLAHFARQTHRLADELSSMIGPYHESLLTLSQLPVPVVCAVQGAVAGGGLGLLWCSDIVIAADDLRLVTAFSRLGVSGDGGSSWYLPRLVGLRRAQELMLESRTLDAAEALDWGLVTRVVERGALGREALGAALRLAAGPTVSLGLQRLLLRGSLERTLPEGYAAEHEAMRVCGATADAAEGMTAFVEHRPATFSGR